MSLQIFLLGMQALGQAADVYGTQQQIRIGRAGAAVDAANIETQLERERLATDMSTLFALQNLRKTMATQQAIFASRGTKIGVGSAGHIAEKSQRNFTADERVRRMNLLAKEAGLRAGKALSGLHQLSSETQLGQSLSRRLIDTLPFAEAANRLGLKEGLND